jgi:branched-chain amino acid transport system substrate-binding protein
MHTFFKSKLLLALALCTFAIGLGAQQPPIQLALIEGLSGPFGNTGEAVFRNMQWAVERVNQRGGVRLPQGARKLVITRYDSKSQTEEALSALRSAIDDGAGFVLQGNSSAVAAALLDALNKHNAREPDKRMLFLNYSAVDPALTNELCSFWHFRFDAHSDMRLAALMQVLEKDRQVHRMYLIGQDYSFGQAVVREAKRQLALQRPDIALVGEELHPVGRVKDFLPYATKIKASGADAVITGNWGNDLSLLIKAARDVGFEGKFYTFYGNALGAPAAIGMSGVGRVVAVADWLPNVTGKASADFYRAFRDRFPQPSDDYVHMRMQLMVEALVQAIETAQSVSAVPVAKALERVQIQKFGQRGFMRASDHQFQQSLVVGLMDHQGEPGVPFDVEGSSYGFRVIKTLSPEAAQLPSQCQMQRP